METIKKKIYLLGIIISVIIYSIILFYNKKISDKILNSLSIVIGVFITGFIIAAISKAEQIKKTESEEKKEYQSKINAYNFFIQYFKMFDKQLTSLFFVTESMNLSFHSRNSNLYFDRIYLEESIQKKNILEYDDKENLIFSCMSYQESFIKLFQDILSTQKIRGVFWDNFITLSQDKKNEFPFEKVAVIKSLSKNLIKKENIITYVEKLNLLYSEISNLLYDDGFSKEYLKKYKSDPREDFSESFKLMREVYSVVIEDKLMQKHKENLGRALVFFEGKIKEYNKKMR